MINPKEGVLDRIEQSFSIFKTNIKELFLPIFIYQFITTIVLSTIIFLAFFNIFDFSNFTSNDPFSKFYMDPKFILFISTSVLFFLIYLILFIPFILCTIKSVKEAYIGKKVDMLDNVKYGFNNLFNSFKTYRYIFVYVALLPCLLIILGGLVLIYGLSYNNDNILIVGYSTVLVGFLWLILSIVIRGIKATFALYSAIDKNEFTKENFDISVFITKNKWWRILGNLFLVGIIISLLSGLVSSFIGSIGGIGYQFNFTDIENIDLGAVVEEFGSFNIFSTISDILNLIISVVGIVFTYIFIYGFFKRLKLENDNNNEINL